MNKHFITILLLLLCVLVASRAEARLTLGVVTGSGEASGEITSDQARSLASLLAEKLQEEIVVKELSDSAKLINWLDQFAMLDLALIATQEVVANPGRFLLIGQFDAQNKLSLVCRQGIVGDLPQRAGSALQESGFATWRSSETILPSATQAPEAVPESIDEVISAPVALQHVPPLSPGRAWSPQDESAYRDILPADEPMAKKLVLGVFPDPTGLVQTSAQAEQLAVYLEGALPVSVKIREFTHLETFTEWFMRYRMVDLAVLSPEIAETKLGRDYVPIVKLFRSDRPGVDSAELVVLRRGQNEEIQDPLQRVLLDMAQTAEGKTLLTEFKVSEIIAPEGVSTPIAIVEQIPEAGLKEKTPPVEMQVKPAEEVTPPAIEYAEPVAPVAPVEIITRELPEFPVLAEPDAILPGPEMLVLAPQLPASADQPVEPVQPVMVEAVETPAAKVAQLEPREPEVLPVTTLPAPPVEPTLEASVETEPLPVPELPEMVAAPPALLAEVVPDVIEPVVESPPLPPEEPALVAVPTRPEEQTLPAPASLPIEEQPAIVVESMMPVEPVLPVVSSPMSDVDSGPDISKEPSAEEQQKILEEITAFADAVPAHELTEVTPVIVDEQMETEPDYDIVALLGKDTVASMVAQPDLPEELRPSGVPIVRPGRIPRLTTVPEDEQLVASMPEPYRKTEPIRPRQLLPEPEPDPGVVYVVPFVAVMVPNEVNTKIFDQFVDKLNQEGENLGLQFLILKEGLQRVAPEWLAVRKYVTGEIYAYVEEAGSTSTEMRTKARLTYRQPNKNGPAFGFEYPVKSFFDNNYSSIDVERAKLSEDIAMTLADELLRVLKN